MRDSDGAPQLFAMLRPRSPFALIVVALAFVEAAPRDKSTVPRTEHSLPCSRVVSRNVRKQIDKEVLKVANKAGIETWPADCPLDPGRDLYFRHEKQKQRKRHGSSNNANSGQWTCGICGKKFKNEHYMDLHLERRHMNETPADGVCLANFCEVFEVCHNELRASARKEAEANCDNSTMVLARQRCEDAMRRCFPFGSSVTRRLHGELSRKWCQVLDCRIREEKRKEHEGAPMPVIVLIILIALVCFIVFSIVVCCVDYSDDIFQCMVDSGIGSIGCVKRMIKAREKTRQAVGQDRTKCI